jgi:hypothetical protein
MKMNGIALAAKADQLYRGQWFFYGSIISVSLVLLITFLGIAYGVPFIEPGNTKPVISNAGQDQIAIENQTVTLDGSGSRDPSGTIVSYLWNQTSGPLVYLSNADNIRSTFMAPNVNNATELQFKLLVKDDKNKTSEDTVNVIVKNSPLQDASQPLVCNGLIPDQVLNSHGKLTVKDVVNNANNTNSSKQTTRKSTLCIRRGALDMEPESLKEARLFQISDKFSLNRT